MPFLVQFAVWTAEDEGRGGSEEDCEGIEDEKVW